MTKSLTIVSLVAAGLILAGFSPALAAEGSTVAQAAALNTDDIPVADLVAEGARKVHENRPEDALPLFSKALEREPDNVDALLGRTRAYLKLRDPVRAQQDAEAARAIKSDDSKIISLLVTIAMSRHDRDEAKRILQEVIDAHPEDVGFRAMMANILGLCEYLDAKACEAAKGEAVAVYDAIIAVSPRAWTYAKRAETRPKADRAKAFTDLETAIALDGNAYFPLQVKARILIEDKAYDAAMPVLEKAIVLTPKEYVARSLRADVYLLTGRTAQGLAEYDAIKRDFPDDAMAYNVSCWGRATRNVELETALADCDASLKLSPRAANFMDSRGFILVRLERYDEAVAAYNAALALEPEMSTALYGRGLAKLRKGDEAGGNADIAAARRISYRIDEEFADFGLKP